MIAALQGVLSEKNPTKILIDCQGVGYEVHIPISTFEKLPDLGETVRLQTILHVREDVMQLFGFFTSEEKNMFQLLYSVSGIGPKSAIGILSSISIKDLRQAIANEDLSLLTQVPGVGRKTAQRLVVELQEKINKLDGPSGMTARVVLSAAGQIASEALMALVSLGYQKGLAEKAVAKAAQELKDASPSLQELIKAALRNASSP
ncbi:MAG: Holliday junction branch migration protein RuvA [Bacteroidetes bacterium]|nr:Holliday junction branch migration protein RuvA [Bacteroidota bacterium]